MLLHHQLLLLQGQVQFSIRQASSPAELRAAGYLRAHSFYHYPPDRSEYSARVIAIGSSSSSTSSSISLFWACSC